MADERDLSEKDMAILERFGRCIAEHFDTVQILVTKHDPAVSGGTVYVSFGIGNIYARYGQVKAWMVQADEAERIKVRQQFDLDPWDDDEDEEDDDGDS